MIDRDIWAATRLVILHHGEDAVIRAAERADALLDAGDMAGQRVWLTARTDVRDPSESMWADLLSK
jgi:hypothetical protein